MNSVCPICQNTIVPEKLGVDEEILKQIGLTVEKYLASSKLEKEAVWEEFRKRIS